MRRLYTTLLVALLTAWPAQAQDSQPASASTSAELLEADGSEHAAALVEAERDAVDGAEDETEVEDEVETAVETSDSPAALLPTPQQLFDQYAPGLAIVAYQVEVPAKDGGVRAAHQLGVVISEDGLVMLGGHLQALNMKPFNFRLTIGKEEHTGELLRREGQLNVSYVRASPKDSAAKVSEADDTDTNTEGASEANAAFEAVSFDEELMLEVGEPVWVIGMLPEQVGFAKHMRRQRIAAVLEEPARVYLLDGSPNPGENGGLVLTEDGRAVGVVGYELSRQQGGEIYTRHGLPLVIPGKLLNASIAEPRATATDKQKEAWFGVLLQPLNNDFKIYFGIEDTTGCIISNVVPDSPAAKGGLERGDIIVEMEGEPVDIPNDLAVLTFTRSIRDRPIGTEVALKYLRDGELQETTVQLAAIPKTAAKADTFNQPAWGLRVRELTNDIIYLLNLPKDITGVAVDHVEQGGPGQAAGLQPGDIVREINSLTLENLADYRDVTDQVAGLLPDKIVLFLQRGPRTGFTTLEPDWRLPAKD